MSKITGIKMYFSQTKGKRILIKSPCAYTLTQVSTGKVLIAHAINVGNALYRHRVKLQNKKHPNLLLQEAFNQDPNFKIFIWIFDKLDEAIEYEHSLIKELKDTNFLLNKKILKAGKIHFFSKSLVKGDKKTCSYCQELKTLDHFEKAKETRLGLSATCQECTKKIRIQKDREKGIEEKRLSIINKDNKKLCLKCNTLKPLFDFNKMKLGINGLSNRCIDCDKINAKVYRVKHAVLLKEKRKAFRADNPTSKAESRIRVHERKTGEVVYRDGSVNNAFLKELLQTEICHYCKQNTPLEKRTLDHKTSLSKQGKHIQANCCMACRRCNSRKQTMSEEEFFTFLVEKGI